MISPEIGENIIPKIGIKSDPKESLSASPQRKKFMTQRNGRVVSANVKPHQNTYPLELVFMTPQGEGHISASWHI